MLEKLAWAERCVSRMKLAAKDDAEETQDHFWSFLHASHLIWFYFGRCAVEVGHGKKEAQRLVDSWKASAISDDEAEAWNTIQALRTEDAHTQPVATDRHQVKALMIRNKKMMIRNGRMMVRHSTRYFVGHKNQRFDALRLSVISLRVLRKFVNQFDSLL